MTRKTTGLVTLIAVLAACASTGTPAPASASASNVITRAELDAAGSTNTYDVIVRLRPNYLRSRGPTSVMNASARTVAVVFVNETEYGDLESLRRFPATRIEEIRYYSGPEATTKFGSPFGAGVIALKPRVQ
jgi:hypothetical protein